MSVSRSDIEEAEENAGQNYGAEESTEEGLFDMVTTCTDFLFEMFNVSAARVISKLYELLSNSEVENMKYELKSELKFKH